MIFVAMIILPWIVALLCSDTFPYLYNVGMISIIGCAIYTIAILPAFLMNIEAKWEILVITIYFGILALVFT